jgi:hypothetical protein
MVSVPTQPAHIHVRVTDELRNIGDRNLSYAEVNLPASYVFGTMNLSVMVDGRPGVALPATPVPGTPARLLFDPPWTPNQVRIVTFDYDYEPELEPHGPVFVSARAFYLVDPNALPKWVPPFGLLAKAEMQSRKEQLDVTVPSDFSVLASGSELRPRRQKNAMIHRFRLSSSMFHSFVISGRYHQQRVRTKDGDVVFWTFRPLNLQEAQEAAGRLAATNAIFTKAFGPVGKRFRLIRIVEAPTSLGPIEQSEAGIAARSFPEGVLLDTRAFVQDIATEPVLNLAEYELARTWFGWRSRPDPGAEDVMGWGASLFAVVLAAEERGGETARRRQIMRFLSIYDRTKALAGEPPLLKASGRVTREQRVARTHKAALFGVALEDLSGKQNFERAVQHLLRARAGTDLSVEDLRSALEASTGRDLSSIFRAWLNGPDVPEDFRVRYHMMP